MKGKTDFLTGIRGLAALAVFITHFEAGGIFSGHEGLDRLVAFGRYGVIIFFVLSAYTISLSISRTTNFKFSNYLKKRTLRIVPLYLFLLVIVALFIKQYSIAESLALILPQITFLDLFHLPARASLIGASWTLAIEFFYYLLIPGLFFYFSKNKRRVITSIFLGFIISTISIKYLFLPYFAGTPIQHFSIEGYAFTYMIGISIFFFLQKFKEIKISSLQMGLFLLTLFLYPLMENTTDQSNILFITIWSALLIIFCSGGNTLTRKSFENKVIVFLGTISYSFYLIHAIILQLLINSSYGPMSKFVIGLFLTTILSIATYYLIERPFINLSKRITA